MQGLQATFHLQKYLVMEVNITPMPPSCVPLCFVLVEKMTLVMIKKSYGLIYVT
jgi:hypothetical protein